MPVSLNKTDRLYSWIIKAISKIFRKSIPQYILEDKSPLQTQDINKYQLIEGNLSDMDILLKQVISILHREVNVPPPPPKHLQVRVVGGYVPNFIDSGYSSVYPTLNNILEPVSRELKDFQSILDFGCGCGSRYPSIIKSCPK